MFRSFGLIILVLLLIISCKSREKSTEVNDNSSAQEISSQDVCQRSVLGDTSNWAEPIPAVDTIPIYALFESTSVNTLLNGEYDARVEVIKIASDSFQFSMYAIDPTNGTDISNRVIYSRFPCPQICNEKSNNFIDSIFVASSKFCRIHIDSVLNKQNVNNLSTRFKNNSSKLGIYGVEKSLADEIHHKNDPLRVFHGQ